MNRRSVTLGLAAAVLAPGFVRASAGRPAADEVLQTWYRLVLELVRHTPTYTPPVASRAFAYLGVTAYEVVALTGGGLTTLAGQLNGLTPVPAPAGTCDPAVMLHAAMASGVKAFFSNTGPTGQRALAAMDRKLGARVTDGVDPALVAGSRAAGEAVAAHILAWSADDGGAVVENMGFPYAFDLAAGPDKWVPTSLIAVQQLPLLPGWGGNRTFAMPTGATCGLPPPPAYSEEKGSEFYAQALEVFETKKNLTKEQRAIARFWSDDPMLSPTPPGHWISIAMQLLEREGADAARRAEVLALTGIAVADAFIGCWQVKFRYDLLRPVTYIRRTMDPKWESTMTTPPFPEYNFAFEDATGVPDGLPARSFTSFTAAAEEAGISRLYGGIHYRAAIEQGLAQGRCTGAFAAALKTRG
jgi:hypothetical protein